MTSAANDDRWINIPGVHNMRDLGGLPTATGRRTSWRRLIRSDNLRALTSSGVKELMNTYGVRSVVDLRTEVEVTSEGRGPFAAIAAIDLQNLSLFPSTSHAPSGHAEESSTTMRLPWSADDGTVRPVLEVYLGYLSDRADSMIAALRVIARSSGSTIVHCAAGKDRTGIVCAWALAEVGVAREAIVDDYVLSATRLSHVLADMRERPTYDDDFVNDLPDSAYAPRADTMSDLLSTVDREYGGVPAWLRQHGWTEADATALRAQLVDG